MLDDDLTRGAGVVRDLPGGASRALRTMSTPTAITVELDLVEHRDRLQERRATTGDETLLDGRAGRRQRVDAVLLLLQLDLGGRADLDHRDTDSLARRSWSFSRS